MSENVSAAIGEVIAHLEKGRMYFEPYKYVKKYIRSTADLFSERKLLRSVSFNERSIRYLASLIAKDIKANKRFKRYECLKILKTIIKNRRDHSLFRRDLIDDLFFLYQRFVFSGDETIQWAVSVYIKDQVLGCQQIQWLIDHYQESTHLVNRLLRYPVRHKLIVDWAESVYRKGEISERLSEIVGALIDEDVPSFIRIDARELMWAIYYSKCSSVRKTELILKYMDYDDYGPALEVAARLGLNEISKELLEYYQKGLNSTID